MELGKDRTEKFDSEISNSYFSTEQWNNRFEKVFKTTAWLIIFFSASFHIKRLFQNEQGGETCPLLFKSGYWLDDKWQPDGCLMHQYSQSEARTCLQNQRVAIIGDSRMRSLYFQLANTISQKPVATGKYHSDLRYEDNSNTSIEFYWLPEMNESIELLLRKWTMNPEKMPSLMMLGVGTWAIKNKKLSEVVNYGDHLKKLSVLLEDVGMNITLRRFEHQKYNSSRFHHEPQIIWMMQDPVVESKLSKERKAITNDKIDMYNYAAQKSLNGRSALRIMYSTAQMSYGKPSETQDGLHYSAFILRWKVDAILNAFCNNYIYPSDASCCKSLEQITKLQFNAFALLATSVLIWMIMYVCRKLEERKLRKYNSEVDEITEEKETIFSWLYNDRLYLTVKSLAKLGAIMLYIFLADSSLLYNKENRRYSHVTFFLPLILMAMFGMAFRVPARQSGVLNTDQLNEWKGWMMVVFMLYNYTHADSVLPIFVNVRVIVASFLFIVGFLHFKQFWYSGDYGLYRICKVMVRLNLFCTVLCLVMGHPYQFYYLVPLLSFWYIMVYLLMALIPRISEEKVVSSPQKNLIMIGKFVALFVLIFVVWGYQNICERVFSQPAVSELFVDENGDIKTWRENSGLHRYAVLYGMICGFVYVTLKRYKIISDVEHNGMLVKSTAHALIISIICFIAIVAYEIQAFTCDTQETCDNTHTLASLIPITAFVLLRNIPGWLRTKYSVFFAWLGEMSIELYLGQYHIWLSNDTHGLHVLVPDFPVLNGLVTSFTFVCVMHEVKKICEVLTDDLVTKDVRVMLKRLVAFILALFVIWYHKTHEKKPTLY